MIMARIVRAAGPTAGLLALDVVQPQILMEMEGVAEDYHLHVLHHRIHDATWVTTDADDALALDDLTEFDVVPLQRLSALPMPGRPFMIPKLHTPEEWRTIVARARQFAVLHGWVDPAMAAGTVVGTGTADGWFISDTSLAEFGDEVPAVVLADPTLYHTEGACGLFKIDFNDGDGPTWVTGQRVLRDDLDDWKTSKHSGGGRDPRLLPEEVTTSGRKLILVRDAAKECSFAQPPDKRFFQRPHALKEIHNGIESSGLEVSGWIAQYLATSGINVKSGLAMEFTQLVYALHFLLCADLLDVSHLAGAEHLSRCILMILKAVRRSPKNPDFEGLDVYQLHLQDSSGAVHAPEFDKHASEYMRNTAVMMKQDRLNREEKEADEKRKKGKKDKGDGKGADA